MKVFVLILLLFAIGPSHCEILTSVSSKKAIIYSDKDYESHIVFINSGNNKRLKHIITQECEIHGFLGNLGMIATRTKRKSSGKSRGKVGGSSQKIASHVSPHQKSAFEEYFSLTEPESLWMHRGNYLGNAYQARPVGGSRMEKVKYYLKKPFKFMNENKETLDTIHTVVGIEGELTGIGKDVHSIYTENQQIKGMDNIAQGVDRNAQKIHEIAENGKVLEQKVDEIAENGKVLEQKVDSHMEITLRQQIEKEADDVIRPAVKLLFNDHKLSPLLLDINPLVEGFVFHDLGNIRLIDLIQAKVTNCYKVVGDDRVFVAISVRIPNKIEVEEFTQSIDTGFIHEDQYYFFDLPQAVYSKNGTQFMIPLDKCIEKDNYLCPFRVIEQTACFYGNTSECSLIAVPLENNKCGITSIRRDPAFGAIVVANTKEMFEVGGGSSRTMEVEPNSVLRVNVRHGKVIEVCDQTITSMRHDLDETKIDVIPSAVKEAWPAQENHVLEKMAQSRFGKDFGKDGQLPIKSSFSMELIVGISVLIGIIVLLLLGLFCYCCRHHYKRVETQ